MVTWCLTGQSPRRWLGCLMFGQKVFFIKRKIYFFRKRWEMFFLYWPAGYSAYNWHHDCSVVHSPVGSIIKCSPLKTANTDLFIQVEKPCPLANDIFFFWHKGTYFSLYAYPSYKLQIRCSPRIGEVFTYNVHHLKKKITDSRTDRGPSCLCKIGHIHELTRTRIYLSSLRWSNYLCIMIYSSCPPKSSTKCQLPHISLRWSPSWKHVFMAQHFVIFLEPVHLQLTSQSSFAIDKFESRLQWILSGVCSALAFKSGFLSRFQCWQWRIY